MKALIIGCGYVGAALGAELARQGHEVYGVRRSRGNEQELKAAGIIPLNADITQRETLSRLPSGWDWVVNCVSASGGGVEEYRGIYVDGTRNLLKWLKAFAPGKFVYTSSTGVYGQNDGSRVDEWSATTPEAETGRTLVEAEQLVIDAARGQDFPGVVLRLAGIYGPGRGFWLRQYLAGEARLEGAGARILNMIHRDDAVGAILAALQRGRAGEVYNVVDNEPVTQRVMFEWLSAKLGRAMPASVAGNAPGSSKRGVTNKSVSNQRLRQELGYELKYPTFREGFAEELRKLGH